MDWAGKTAVVTGAGSGLGAAMATRFASVGMNVALLDIDDARAHETAQRLSEGGTRVIATRVDVADIETLHSAAHLVQHTFGGCDVLCANVGVQQFGALDRLTDDDWEWVLSVNVMGPVRTVRAFLPLLRNPSGDRHIVLTASSSYFVPGIRIGAYVTSKYAVVGFGEVLRMELGPEGIGVTTLFPAGMSTRHLESSAAARPDALGESVTLPDDLTVMLASSNFDATTDVTSPEHAIRNLLADIEADVPYAITHGAYRDRIDATHDAVIAAYDRMEST